MENTNNNDNTEVKPKRVYSDAQNRAVKIITYAIEKLKNIN